MGEDKINPHVLVVDDSLIVCKLLQIELAPFEIEVSTADDIETRRIVYQRAAELHGLQELQCRFEVSDKGAHFTLGWRPA